MPMSEAQRRVLAAIVKNTGPALTAWALGRNTCEALRKRGLIEAGEANRPITRYGDPFIYATEAGRLALKETSNADE